LAEESDDADVEEFEVDDRPHGSGWGPGSFLAGLLVGAALGAGVALFLAPGSGQETRRVLRRRARAIRRDAAGGWISARDEARRLLREKKKALRDRLEHAAERLE
jgi:gas vesicle protein